MLDDLDVNVYINHSLDHTGLMIELLCYTAYPASRAFFNHMFLAGLWAELIGSRDAI